MATIEFCYSANTEDLEVRALLALETFLTRSNERHYQQTQAALKRLVDFVLVGPALLLLWPLFLLIALAVKIDSPGPVLYRRRVLGRDGRVFAALKFRTMHVNGDDILARYPGLAAELRRNYQLRKDPRLTRMGALLRQFGLDELPQLFNVLAQDMSLIGPRLIAPEEIEAYGNDGPELLTVTPGIMGLWQVNGRGTTTEERIALDMTYVHNHSVWLDLKILGSALPRLMQEI